MAQHKTLYTFLEFSKNNYNKNFIIGKVTTLILIKICRYITDNPFQSILIQHVKPLLLSKPNALKCKCTEATVFRKVRKIDAGKSHYACLMSPNKNETDLRLSRMLLLLTYF